MTADAIPRRAAPAALRLVPLPLRRFVRKHGLALLLLGGFHFVLFFPTLFMGRVLSPNDVYYHYAPWSMLRSVEAQNPTLDAAATGILPVISLVRDEPSAFFWERYLASGIPGYAGSVVLSPFLLLPGVLFPLLFLYTGIILAKLNFSFAFAYLWLREERMGKRAAAAGAMIFAAAGCYSTWWLMHPTNATVLYPALFFVVSRIFHRRPVGILPLTLLALAAVLSGFPAMVAYVVYPLAAYVVLLAVKRRFLPGSAMLRAAAALVIALLVAAPFLFAFTSFLKKTGYLEARVVASAKSGYPLHHVASFFQPYRLGDPAAHLWTGDRGLGYSNDFVESTVYLGAAALPLALLGLFRRRSRQRWFWLATFAVVAAAVFGKLDAAAALPGIRYSPLPRLRVLLPLPAAYLAASGFALLQRLAAGLARFPLAQWMRRGVPALLALFIAGDLAFFAARFYPYLDYDLARVPPTPTTDFLDRQPAPFRIAPFFTALYPNSAEWFRFEDVRSHFSSEADYRAMMLRIDPGSWDTPTVLLFNGLKTNLADPFLSLLNVRYLVEQPNIDIVRWSILKNTVAPPPAAPIVMRPFTAMEQMISVDAEPFYFAAIPFQPYQVMGGAPRVTITLTRPETGEVLWRQRIEGDEIRKMPNLYVPVYPFARLHNRLLVRIASEGVEAQMAGGPDLRGVPSFGYGRVTIPVAIERELPDGRIFRNASELPRWFAVWNVEPFDRARFLADAGADFATTAFVTGAPDALRGRLSAVPPLLRRVVVTPRLYRGDRQLLDVESQAPFLLTTSEKADGLRVKVDGRSAPVVRANGLFAAVAMEKGRHRVEFTRRIGGPWWPASVAGLLLLAAGTLLERRLRRRAAATR